MMKISQALRQYEMQILSEKKVKAGLRAEELREKLDPEAAVVGLMSLGEQAKTCDLVDLPRLQFQATILTTILKKCMPDLKALEISSDKLKTTTLVIDLGDVDFTSERRDVDFTSERRDVDFGNVVSDTADYRQ
jgi:hypothetical protein